VTSSLDTCQYHSKNTGITQSKRGQKPQNSDAGAGHAGHRANKSGFVQNQPPALMQKARRIVAAVAAQW